MSLLKRFREWLRQRSNKPTGEHQPERDVSCECPWCGFMGSKFEIIYHCLSYHKR